MLESFECNMLKYSPFSAHHIYMLGQLSLFVRSSKDKKEYD